MTATPVTDPKALAFLRKVPRASWLDHLPTEGEMIEVAERTRPYRTGGELPVRIRV